MNKIILEKNISKNEGGFTLIELLVVIAIIGILATIVLTSLGNAKSSGNDGKIQAQLAHMRSQSQLYSNYNAVGIPITNAQNINTTLAATCGSNTDLFFDKVINNSLCPMIVGLPDGAYFSYTSEATLPAREGKWAFAAGINSGNKKVTCVDYNGIVVTKNYSHPLDTGAANSPASNFPNFSTYSCN